MSTFKTTTESAATKDGIIFVRTAPTGGEPEIAGDIAYAEIVTATAKLLAFTTEPKVKVVLKAACVEVHKTTGGTISVVYRQGAPIVKSLQRMVRRMARANASKAQHHTTNTEPRKPPTLVELEAQVETWPHPAGTPVCYWSGAREGQPRRSTTTTTATVLGGHTAGLYIAGAGFMALSHVEIDADGVEALRLAAAIRRGEDGPLLDVSNSAATVAHEGPGFFTCNPGELPEFHSTPNAD